MMRYLPAALFAAAWLVTLLAGLEKQRTISLQQQTISYQQRTIIVLQSRLAARTP